MLWAAHCSSSGALNVFAASGLYAHIVISRCQGWMGTCQCPLSLDNGRSSSGALNCIFSLWFIWPYGDRPLPRLNGLLPVPTQPWQWPLIIRSSKLYLQPLVYMPIWWPAVAKAEWALASAHSAMAYIYIYICIFCGAATQRGSWPPHSWCF